MLRRVGMPEDIAPLASTWPRASPAGSRARIRSGRWHDGLVGSHAPFLVATRASACPLRTSSVGARCRPKASARRPRVLLTFPHLVSIIARLASGGAAANVRRPLQALVLAYRPHYSGKPAPPVHFGHHSAPVAQLDRASGYEPEGREFESLRARQIPAVCCRVYDTSACHFAQTGGSAMAAS